MIEEAYLDDAVRVRAIDPIGHARITLRVA